MLGTHAPRRTRSARRVAWEATRACDGACPDCPLAADRWRDPGELSTIEAMLMLNRLRARGCERLAVVGGDPMRRADLEDLVRHAARLGMAVEVTLPGGLAPPPPARLEGLREAGAAGVVVRRCGPAERVEGVVAAARAAGLAVAPATDGGDHLAVSPTGAVREAVPA